MYETHHRLLFRSAGDLSGIEDGSVDLIVTSPPYPMIEMWDRAFAQQDQAVGDLLAEGRGTEAWERMHGVLDRVWAECYRVLTPGAFACINIGDATRSVAGRFRLYSNHTRVTRACEALGFEPLPLVLWRKQTNAPNKFMGSGMLPAGAYVTLEHEYILVLRKGPRRPRADADAPRRRRSAFFWEERNRWFSDVWDFKGVRQAVAVDGAESRRRGSSGEQSGARTRSGAFPFELAYRLINMYSLSRDTVLDPFLGTGTTMAAAMTAGRNSIGVEIDRTFGPAVIRAVGQAAAGMNARSWERLAAHRAFVVEHEAARGAPLTHENRVYGFRVMTSQERELTLSCVEEIERAADDRFVVRHRDMGEADLGDAPPPPALTGFTRPS